MLMAPGMWPLVVLGALGAGVYEDHLLEHGDADVVFAEGEVDDVVETPLFCGCYGRRGCGKEFQLRQAPALDPQIADPGGEGVSQVGLRKQPSAYRQQPELLSISAMMRRLSGRA
jgi:hypothetical protein